MSEKQVRAQYTREFKLEAVRQVRAGQAIAVVAKVQAIVGSNWRRVRFTAKTWCCDESRTRRGYWMRTFWPAHTGSPITQAAHSLRN